jgi:hypothetical protein
MELLEYEFWDGSAGAVELPDGTALDEIVRIESAGHDFHIKSAWLNGDPYIGVCTNQYD